MRLFTVTQGLLAIGRRRPIIPAMSDNLSQKWICEACGFIYDPVEGDPDGGIPPRTPWSDVPEDWFCPTCGAEKSDFVPI